MLAFLFSISDGQGAGVEKLLGPARGGDQQAREDLLRKYTPLVLRVASSVSGRYVKVGRDEEVSVGLMALNEAIDRYDLSRGASFSGFSEMVIKRRLIDFYRRQGKRVEIPLSELESEDEEGNPLSNVEEAQAQQMFTAAQEAADRKEEIMRYTRRLGEFGVSFSELVEISPKHGDARERAVEAARIVAQNTLFRQHLITKKELPLKHLETMVGVSRKTLERQRKYIIAVALLLIEDFTLLRRYISQT